MRSGARRTGLARVVALVGAAGIAVAAPAAAQEEEPATEAVVPAEAIPLRDSLRAAVERLAELERGLLRAMQAGDTARLSGIGDRRQTVQTALDSLLERVVLGTEWGGAELERLRARYPGALILDLYAAHRLLRDDRPAAALELTDRLLARAPDDPELHLLHGRALEAIDRSTDAWLAYLRAFDMEPAGEVGEPAFRALVRIADDDGLERLLDHVRRLRRMSPAAGVLKDRQIELLQRLGRLDAARALQDSAAGGRSA
jgi:tetratricopeptide (TPR) repeat protein